MLDVVIRNGLICDGSGGPAHRGDLGIDRGRIVVVGEVGEPGRRTLDADGCVVAPGFIDPHTHFDAQLCWDPQARPSLEHGVTTVVPGNCSLTLAPLRAEQRGRLVRMFRQIEDMPQAAFDQGVDWTWESYEGYLAALRRNLAIHVAPLVGHSAIRMWVMGEEAHHRPAKPEEIAAMQALLRDCLAAGAVGLSTSYVDVDEHWKPVPSRHAEHAELDALCSVLGERGRILQVVPEFYDAELNLTRVDLLAELSCCHGIPTTFSPLFQSRATPELPDRVLARVSEQFARGARVWPQVQTRPIDLSFSLETRSLIFARFPTWMGVLSVPDLEARKAQLRDPALRARLVQEVDAKPADDTLSVRFDFGRMVVRDVALEKNRGRLGRTLRSIADETGSTPANVILDLALEEDLRTAFLCENMGHDDVEKVGRMLAHPHVHVGASDAGAHVASFATYGDTGYLFSKFVREAGALSLEQAVRKLTHEPASIWGIAGRGLLRPGYAADVVIFDADRIGRGPEVPARDLPGGGFRYVRHSLGVEAVLVQGEPAWTASEGYTEARSGQIA
jgi:N-acyl-D-aspartate/D-glutamate deacylase